MRCGRDIADGEAVGYGKGKLCKDCAAALENSPVSCPVCGAELPAEEAVAMLLTRAPATPEARLLAQSALVQVCPRCHVLFFDDFQYKLLEGLRS